MHVTGIERRSAWPETQIVLDMFLGELPRPPFHCAAGDLAT